MGEEQKSKLKLVDFLSVFWKLKEPTYTTKELTKNCMFLGDSFKIIIMFWRLTWKEPTDTTRELIKNCMFLGDSFKIIAMFLRMTITCHNWSTIILEHLMRLKNHPITSGESNTHKILAQTLKKTHIVHWVNPWFRVKKNKNCCSVITI